ncbi:MAG TPA: hypothetical protein VFM46_05785, partial [Pseudomonadales bacterium]|nr:hypothetical protein [Pseudomonadales bacterium]
MPPRQKHRSLNILRLLTALALCLVSVLMTQTAVFANSSHDPQGFLDSLYYLKDDTGALTFEQAQTPSNPWQKANTAS